MAFLVEIGVASVRRRLRDGAQDAAAIPQLDCQEVAAPDGAVGPHLSLHGDAQDVSPSQVSREIHLPGEHVRQVIDQILEILLPESAHVPAEAGRPEARLDDAGDPDGIQDEGDRLDAGGPDGVGVDEVQERIGIQREEDSIRNAGRIEGKAERRSRAQGARAAVRL